MFHAPALLNAAERGHLAVVRALLDKGADVNAKHNSGVDRAHDDSGQET